MVPCMFGGLIRDLLMPVMGKVLPVEWTNPIPVSAQSPDALEPKGGTAAAQLAHL